VSRWRIAFDRIGGPDAVTWPAFWITYASSLIAHLTTGGAVDASLGIRVLLVTVAQVASFVPLLLLRWTVLRHPSRPLPWVAVAGFAASAVIRGTVLTSLLLSVGAVTEPLWIYRVVASLQNNMLLLIIVALVVSSMRAHTRSLEQLLEVQGQLVHTEVQLLEDVTTRNEQVVLEVQERLRGELVSLDVQGGAESVRELQRLASDVVRPMSHQLAMSVPTVPMTAPPIDAAHLTWRQAVLTLVDRPPLRPLLAGAYMAVILAQSALGVFGVSRGIPMTGVVFLCVSVGSWGANWVLGFLLPHLGPRACLLAVLLASLVVGFASALAAGVFVPPAQSRTIFIVGGGIFITGVLLLTAAVTTVLRRQRVTEQQLITSTQQLRRQLVRLRQAQWLQRQGLARALHGPVQAAVTSAALRLDAAVRSGDTGTDLLADTRQSLLAAVDVLDSADSMDYSLDLALARIQGTWEGLCEITSQIDARAGASLADDPIAAAVVVDLMSEAVSNAVRHGEARRVIITMSLDEQSLLTLTIRDDGETYPDVPLRGLGSALLDDCTMEWMRDMSMEGTTLTTVLPTVPASTSS